jgi:hypothetical protein
MLLSIHGNCVAAPLTCSLIGPTSQCQRSAQGSTQSGIAMVALSMWACLDGGRPRNNPSKRTARYLHAASKATPADAGAAA